MGGLSVIVGLGETGLSCARYLDRRGLPFRVADDNPSPSGLPGLREIKADAEVLPLDFENLQDATRIIVSPGVPLALPALQSARDAGIPITGDVALFAEQAAAPIAAVTGTNGKTTVTALLADLASRQLDGVHCGGNIGTPCLDLLTESARLYVIEVSSYQLESSPGLAPEVAVVLNLAPDHLDRYESLSAYYDTKAAIYRHCKKAVVNRGVSWSLPIPAESPVVSFGLDEPQGPQDFGLRREKGHQEVIVQGDRTLLNVRELPLLGRHNVQNVMAALAMGVELGLNVDRMVADLVRFEPLPHRCEFVGAVGGVRFVNDSKATNVAATVSAVQSLSEKGAALTVLLGGLGKNADFSPLADVAGHIDLAIVFGRDRAQIQSALEGVCDVMLCADLGEAVELAVAATQCGDMVLLSPACASQDMFEDYRARGDAFRKLVRERAA